MLVLYLRRWPSNKPTLAERLCCRVRWDTIIDLQYNVCKYDLHEKLLKNFQLSHA